MSVLLRAACGLAASLVLALPAAAQKDGADGTIVIGERVLGATGCTAVATRGPKDGAPGVVWTSLYLRPSAPTCGLPIAAPHCPVARAPISRVLDASSNTIYVGEAGGPWCVGAIGNGQCAVQTLPGLISDGTSNTLLVGELLPPFGGAPLECALPVGDAGCTLGGPGSIADGTSNTIFVGYGGGGYGCLLPAAGTRDLPDVRVAPDGGICTPTPGGIVDGTSNTIFVGECAPAAVVTPEPATLPLAAAGLAALAALAALAPLGAAARRRGA
jgi:hypothetical protein